MTARRRCSLATVLLAVGLVAGTSGCGVGPERQARALGPQDAPAGVLVTPSGSAQTPGASAEQLTFVRDARLATVSRAAVEVTPGAALRDLLGGPLPAEREQGLTTALPTGSGALTRLAGGVASVSLDGALLDNGRSDQVLALAQLVVTLDALPEVQGVRFLRDGVPLPVPRADGAIVDRPLTTADYQDLLGP